ncbi:MAG: helix-turn-helix domain-containing protein, partial [Aestuariivirga sp.]
MPMDHSPQDRQTRILDAAQRAFAHAGMHQATMADVAREAGMTAGNLY